MEDRDPSRNRTAFVCGDARGTWYSDIQPEGERPCGGAHHLHPHVKVSASILLSLSYVGSKTKLFVVQEFPTGHFNSLHSSAIPTKLRMLTNTHRAFLRQIIIYFVQRFLRLTFRPEDNELSTFRGKSKLSQKRNKDQDIHFVDGYENVQTLIHFLRHLLLCKTWWPIQE